MEGERGERREIGEGDILGRGEEVASGAGVRGG